MGGYTLLSPRQIEAIRVNVSNNLEHDIPEIRVNAMQLLIELRMAYPGIDLDFAVIPVMRLLRQDATEEHRILAAMTLYHLNTRKGRFAVERRALYDRSPRVARHCARLASHWDKHIPSDSEFADGHTYDANEKKFRSDG